MKKLLSYLFLLVAVIVLASCEAVVSVSSLQVSGQKEEFVLGEEFSTGEMTVIAVYTNGNEEDVTSKVKVTPSTDMSAAGNFTVEVYFEGCTAEYNIRIEQPQFVSLEVKHELANKVYLVGQELSTEGVEVVAHYTNSITGETQETVENYELVVKNAAGEVVKGAFEAVGTYTVAISFGGKTESYEVEVSNNFASVEAAIAAGVANAGKVISGSLTKTTSWSEPTVTEYAFGENYFTYGDEYGTYHYSLTEDESVIGAYESDGYVQSYGGDVEIMQGLNEWVLYYTYNLYGAEGFVQSLYNIGVEAGCAISESVSEGVYSYSYNFTLSEEDWEGNVSYYYYNVAVSFKLGNGAEFSEVVYTQSQYYEDQVVVAEDGSWTVVEGVVSENVMGYTFVQEAGERTAENPYAPEKVLYESFDLVDAEGNLAASEYTTNVGESVQVYIGNTVPETALSEFNEFIIESVDGYIYGYVYNGVANITVYSAGTVNVTISTGSIVKEITIVAIQPDPEGIDTYVFEEVEGWWGPQLEQVYATSAEVETGEVLYVIAEVYPSAASQAISYAIKDNLEGATLVESSSWDVPMGTYEFVATVAGTYVIEVASIDKPEVTAEMTIVVTESTKEPVTLDGTWTASFTNPRTGMTYDFVLELGAAGTGTLNCYNSEFVEFSYEVEGSAITYTTTNAWTGSMDGCTVDLLSGTMELTVSTEDYGYYPLSFEKEVEGGSEGEATLVGEWTGSFPHPLNGLPCSVVCEFLADGTGFGTFNGTYIEFTYQDNGGIISFVAPAVDGVSFTIGTYTEGYAEVTIFVQVNGTQCNAVLTK